MKALTLLCICISVVSYAQQPIKPVVVKTNNIQPANMDVAELTKQIQQLSNNITEIADQIKQSREQISLLQKQRVVLQTERQRKQAELNSLKDKDELSTQQEARKKQLEKEIKDLDTKIEETTKKINEISDNISMLNNQVEKMEQKIKQAEQNQKLAEQKKAQDNNKTILSDMKDDAVSGYARVKIFLDSLPEVDKSKLSADEINTLAYYNNLFNSNTNFKNAVNKELHMNRQMILTDQSKDQAEVKKDHHKALMDKIKRYLSQLAEAQNKVQF